MQTRDQSLAVWRWLSRRDALLLALATLFGYAVAFSYESGVCAYFGIPMYLVSVNLAVGLATAAALIGFLYSLYWFPQLRSVAARMATGTADYDALASLTLSFVFAYFILCVGIGANVLVVTIINAAIYFALRSRPAQRLRRRLMGTAPASIPPLLEDLLPPRIRFALSLALLILICSFLSGRSQAAAQVHYSVNADGRTYAVLRIYSDNIITARYSVTPPRPIWFFWTARQQPAILIEPGIRIFRLGGSFPSIEMLPLPAYPLQLSGPRAYTGFLSWVFSYETLR